MIEGAANADPSFGLSLADGEAALWFLGQAGCLIRASAVTVAIDPYLTDSIGAEDSRFSRPYPPPVEPEQLNADIFIVTHSHMDHLDPETIGRYARTATTDFVAPHLTAANLAALGVPTDRIHRLDVGERMLLRDVEIRGVYALATEIDALDTTGYLVTFANGRSVYHSTDTALSPLLLEAAPYAEVLLVAINGEDGNLDSRQAVELTKAVGPRCAIPIHYDLISSSSVSPETFCALCGELATEVRCVVPGVMQPYVWR